MTHVIVAERLGKRYGSRIGLAGVDLAIGAGEIFGFLGPNGAGKTTTIRLLLGLVRPTSGTARVLGHDCWRESARLKAEIGYVPGDLRLYSWMTARSALRTSGAIRGRDLLPRGLALAERFRLEVDVRVRKMSRGMRQKLGLLLALAHEPRLLILDEPTSGLDPLMQDELARCLRERAAQGHTVFFSSHTLSEVEHLCDRVAIVREGSIVADETLDSLRARARRLVTMHLPEGTSAEASLPERLTITRSTGSLWTCAWEGPAAELIAWAHQHGVRDMTIGPPDLETAFRSYYQEPQT